MATKKHVALASVTGFAAAYLLIALEMKLALRSLITQGEKQSKMPREKVLIPR